jgi:hypothetical protein
VIRYIDDDPMARLKARARRKGVSLERQLRIIVTEAARLDASVAVKWVIPEVLSDRADTLRGRADRLLAPDLLLPEAANARGKKLIGGRSPRVKRNGG